MKLQATLSRERAAEILERWAALHTGSKGLRGQMTTEEYETLEALSRQTGRSYYTILLDLSEGLLVTQEFA